MKIGVSSYSYSQYLASGKMDIYQIIDLAAETGYAGIEFANLVYPDNMPRGDYAESLRQSCEKDGIEICACAAAGDLARDNLASELERLAGEIEFASLLGAKSVRIDLMADFTAEYDTPAQCYDRVVPGVRQLADHAAKQNIVLTTENHGRLFCESSRLEQLFSLADHDNFGLLADIGNFATAEEDSAYATGRLARWIRHVHIKDFHWKSGGEINPGEGWFTTRGGNFLRGAIVGHGTIPVASCLRMLAGQKYNGWLVVEFEGIEDPALATRIGLANLKQMLDLIE